MKKISFDFKHCFGIGSLSDDFDFEKSSVNLIYAKNGTMKSSFAKIFKKYQEGKQSDIKDCIFNNTTNYEIKIDEQILRDNDKIDNIFVLGNLDATYQSNNISNLLLNPDLKQKFDNVLELKYLLLKRLNKNTGLTIPKKKEDLEESKLENKFLKDFGIEGKSFLDSLASITIGTKNEIDVLYKDIFDNSKLEQLIESDQFQSNIDNFMKKSDEIYSKSEYSYLKKGELSFGKFKEIQETLTKNNFFVKNNSVNLNGSIKNKEDLKKEVDNIQEILMETIEFKKISEELNNSDKGKKLLAILENNINIVLELKNYQNFRKKLWYQYLLEKNSEVEKSDFEILNEKYKELKNSITPDNLKTSKWRESVDKFNDRFSMPFRMEISNFQNAIFGDIPIINFAFCNKECFDECEEGEIVRKNKNEILETLSQGEKRALYLLNIIFDIETFKKEIEDNPGREVLLIIDDIADSFDYRNKYAIVEYLKEISEENNFYSIILTHNFDFFRFLRKRLKCDQNSFEIIREKNKKLTFIKSKNNEPREIWKSDLNEKNIIALIPFVRNLVEYGINDKTDFITLTHLLHKKDETNYSNDGKIIKPGEEGQYKGDTFTVQKTEDIDFGSLETLYKKYLGNSICFSIQDKTKSVYDAILRISENISENEYQIENKVILAIAVRLISENFMKKEIKAINSNANSDNIDGNQFSVLYSKYRNLCLNSMPNDKERKANWEKSKDILNQIDIMTPENIHLNSFMYEPILDMDIVELKKIYDKVEKNLN